MIIDNMLEINTPEQLTRALNSLVLTPSKMFDLNRRLANRSRQYFRGQIRQQRDVEGRRYAARKQPKITLDRKTKKAKNHKNMLLGFSKSLKTFVNNDGFAVGLVGIIGNIARVHNEGQSVSFTTHVNGFYNSRTSKWEGGTLTKNYYTMTTRTFINWTPELERELLAMVASSFVNSDSSANSNSKSKGS